MFSWPASPELTKSGIIYYVLNQTYVFVDIETNGGNGEHGKIIEVAALKVHGGVVIDQYVSFINPGSSVPYWITRLTGITGEDVADAPSFTDIADELFQFLDGAIFVAHNVLFDYSFLRRQFKAAGYDFAPQLLCTVKLSRALYPEHTGHSLEKIIQRHHIPVAARHRALDDAKAMLTFTQIALAEKGEAALRDNINRQLKTKNLPPNVDEKVIHDLPDTPGIYIFEDDAGAPLYVGKSINIRSRVRSHFADATTVAKEMKLSLQSHNISYIQTDTELEALLLESAKVKELQPVFNRQLRRKTTQTLLTSSETADGYLSISVTQGDLADIEDVSRIYGVFPSRQRTKSYLEEIARTFQLCPKLLGLEKASGFCFRFQLGLCKGACGGREAPASYNQRVQLALERTKIESWPFASKVIVKLSDHRSLIVNHWIIEAIVNHALDPDITRLTNAFDLDTYKILRSFIRKHPTAVSLMPPDFLEAY